MNDTPSVLETPAFQKPSMPATVVAFLEMYELDTVRPIEFKSYWRTGTCSYGHACKEELKPGELVKSYDLEGQRKILLVGTRMGTVVVFERHPEGRDGIFFSNWPKMLEGLRAAINVRPSMSADAMTGVIGGGYGLTPNVGQMLEALFATNQVLTRAAAQKAKS